MKRFLILLFTVLIVLSGCVSQEKKNTPPYDDYGGISAKKVIGEITRNSATDGFAAEIMGYDIPAVVKEGGGVYYASITFKNVGKEEWSMNSRDFRLGGSGRLIDFFFWRAFIHKTVHSGETITIPFILFAPDISGDYTIELQMVQDGVRYFGDRMKVDIRVDPNLSRKKQKINPDQIMLDFSDADILAIDEFVEETLKIGYKAEYKNEWRKAELKYNGIEYPIEFSMHGDTGEHWEFPVKSYKIKLLDGKKINRMKEFSLIAFKERRYNPMIYQFYAGVMDIFILQHTPVLVSVNDGQEWHIYYLRERRTKETLERNGFSNSVFLSKPFISDARLWPIVKGNMPGHRSFLDFFFSNFDIDGAPIDEQKVNYSIALLQRYRMGEAAKLFTLFDYDYLVNFEAIRSILFAQHDIDGDNLRFIYRETNGKFYPLLAGEATNFYPDILFDNFTNLATGSTDLFGLFATINSDDDFRQAKYRKIWEVVNGKKIFAELLIYLRGLNDAISDSELEISGYSADYLKEIIPVILANSELLKNELSTSKLLVMMSADGESLKMRVNPLSLSNLSLKSMLLNFRNPFSDGTVFQINVSQNGGSEIFTKTLTSKNNYIDIKDMLNNAKLFLHLDDSLQPVIGEIIIEVKYPENIFLSATVEAVNEITQHDLVGDIDILLFKNISEYEAAVKKYLRFPALLQNEDITAPQLRTFEEEALMQMKYKSEWEEMKKNGTNNFYLELISVFINVFQKDNTLRFEIRPLGLSDLLFDKLEFKFKTPIPDGQRISVRVRDETGKTIFENETTVASAGVKFDITKLFEGFKFHIWTDASNAFSKTTYYADIVFIDYPDRLTLESIDFAVSNEVTGAKSKQDDIKYAIADENDYFFDEKFLTPSEVKARHGIFEIENDALVLQGNVRIDSTIIVPYGTRLLIQPGTILSIAPSASLLSYSPVIARGTESEPIIVLAQSAGNPFGVFALGDKGANGSIFEYFQIEGGSEAYINGTYFSGMFSAYHADDITINNSSFSLAANDDALNIKYSNPIIRNSKFFDNSADAIDIDFSGGEIAGNVFKNNGNDAMDFSASDTEVRDNKIYKSGDKCISVGEESNSLIINNIMDGCDIGVEIKDLSAPVLLNNLIINNNVGINSYQKKSHFGSAHGQVWNTLFYNNKKEITFENTFEEKKFESDKSSLTVNNSNVEQGYAGKGNVSREFNDDTYFFEKGGDIKTILRYIPEYKGDAHIGLLYMLETPNLP